MPIVVKRFPGVQTWETLASARLPDPSKGNVAIHVHTLQQVPSPNTDLDFLESLTPVHVPGLAHVDIIVIKALCVHVGEEDVVINATILPCLVVGGGGCGY